MRQPFRRSLDLWLVTTVEKRSRLPGISGVAVSCTYLLLAMASSCSLHFFGSMGTIQANNVDTNVSVYGTLRTWLLLRESLIQGCDIMTTEVTHGYCGSVRLGVALQWYDSVVSCSALCVSTIPAFRYFFYWLLQLLLVVLLLAAVAPDVACYTLGE